MLRTKSVAGSVSEPSRRNENGRRQMTDYSPITHKKLQRRTVLAGLGATVAAPRIALGQSANVIRIGVPTKTYWPTIIAETTIRQKLFDKEDVKAELTIYRSGAEGF